MKQNYNLKHQLNEEHDFNKKQSFNNLIDLLKYRSSHQKNDLAYCFLINEIEKKEITYSELHQKSLALAARLQQKLVANDRVLIALDSSLEYIVAFFACIFAGVTSATAYPPRQKRHLNRLESVVNDCQAKLVLTSNEIINSNILKQSAIFTRMECLPVDDDYSEHTKYWTPPIITKDTLAFLQYTSGSTNSPKGVMVTHGNIFSNFKLLHERLGTHALNKCVSWLPIFHDMGLIAGLLLMLYMGKPSIFMAPLTFLKDPLIWLRIISREKATFTVGPNFAYDLVAKKATEADVQLLDLSNLVKAINGAEPVLFKTLQNFEKKFAPAGLKKGVICPGYGMAEATLAIAIEDDGANRIKTISKSGLNQQIVKEPTEASDITHAISCGITDKEHSIAIVNPVTRLACPPNVVGEIWFSGPSVAAGYLDKKKETRAIFKATIKRKIDKYFLRTGDYGFVDEKGLLYVTGRVKDLIIINGANIYPQDLETLAYQAHPALLPYSCIAFSLPVDDEEKLILVLEAAPQDNDYASIYRNIREVIWNEYQLTLYDIVLIQMRTIPKTSSGKLQRSACRAAYLAHTLTIIDHSKTDVQEASPVIHENVFSNSKINDLLRWMSGWLDKRLGNKELTITQETAWHDLGLTSVIVTELIAELSSITKQNISPAVVWEYDTPYEMLHALDNQPIKTSINLISHSTINNDTAIAIVGMGCRFPNGDNLKTFWNNLISSEDAIKPVSSDRSNYLHLMDMNTKGWYGGFIANALAFDAKLFNISPVEANYLDPQHRLALEVAWESLEDAHINPLNLRGSETGVFLGISSHDYDLLMARADLILDHNLYRLTGTTASTAAGRISYMFGFNGPCKAIDTACSSSLVALHDACVALERKECHLALAGGVNLLLAPDLSTSFKNANMLSPEFRCKTFDKDADGYVRGEGCGWVVLKRLTDAVRDGDRIHGVIRGSAINQDGASQSFTAPNGRAQINVMLKALEQANMQAHEVQYVEAHGTGTPLGDPVEWHSIASVYGLETNNHPVLVSSVKTNIGHLEAAAGIAGVIKTTLALKNQLIPSHLNYFELNPNCDNKTTHLTIPTQTTPWPQLTDSTPRAAAVSAFGFSGTNAHVIISEAPHLSIGEDGKSRVNHSLDHSNIWAISANSFEACQKLLQLHEQTISHIAPENFQDYLIDLTSARSTQLPYRCALVCKDKKEWLKNYYEDKFVINHAPCTPDLVFLFTGQGSQTKAMAKQLYERFCYFRSIINYADKIMQPYLSISLVELLTESRDEINIPLNAQVAIIAFEYALARQWQAFGMNPKILIGHSLGEYAMAAFAGIMDFADALRLVAARSKMLDEIAETGLMLAVQHPYHRLEKHIKKFDQLYIACDNSEQQVVVAGPHTVVKAFADYCKEENIHTEELTTRHAFHTPLMQEAANTMREILQPMKFNPPQFTCISTITGTWCDETTMTNVNYWHKHLIQPVLFKQAIELIKSRKTLTLEVGPKDILKNLVKQQTQTADHEQGLALASITTPETALNDINNAIVEIYYQAINIHWDKYYEGKNKQHYDLPNYPFDHKDYWFIEQPIDIAPATLQENKIVNEVNNIRHEPISVSALINQNEPKDELFNFITKNLAKLLGVSIDDITKTSNWFDLGMDSIMFIQLAKSITQLLNDGREIKSGDFYKHQTIEELISFLEIDKKKNHGSVNESNTDEHLINEQQQKFPVLIPPSIQQNNLWLLIRDYKDNPAYNVAAFRLFKEIPNLALLSKAIKQTISPINILKTSFKIVDNYIYPIINAELPVNMEVLSIQLTNDKDLEDTWIEAIYNKIKICFNIEIPPLFKIYLFNINERKFGLLIVLNHMICDGTSAEILMKKIEDNYLALLNSANGQKTIEQNNNHDNDNDNDYALYIQNTLNEVDKNLAVTIRYINNIGEHQANDQASEKEMIKRDVPIVGIGKKIILKDSIHDKVHHFCQANQISPYTFFLGIYGLTLAEYNKEKNIYILAVRSGRQDSSINEAVGFFADGVPLLIKVGNAIKSYFQQIQVNILNALDRNPGPVPFDKLMNTHFIFPKYTYNFFKSFHQSALFMPETKDYVMDSFIEIDLPYWNYKNPENLYIMVKDVNKTYSCYLIGRSDLYSKESIDEFANLFIQQCEDVCEKINS